MIVGGLFIFSMINFGLFLKMINQEYIATFFSTTTGKEFAVQTYYEEAETYALNFEIFGHHRSFYDSIQSELMKWLNDNWERWEESSVWFTADIISNVPSDMLPLSVLQRMGGERGRKASIAQMKEEAANGGEIVRGADLKVIPN